jgi:hypothetical protein
MPAMCFSYPPDMRPGIGNRNIAQPDLRNPRMMPIMCFRYEADAPRRMPLSCLSYPQMCFGYPADVPLGNRDAAQPALPGLRSMPFTCFRY